MPFIRLQFNTSSAGYEFAKCQDSDVTRLGQGRVMQAGRFLFLSDPRLLASIDTRTHRAFTIVTARGAGAPGSPGIFVINDTNRSDSVCGCP